MQSNWTKSHGWLGSVLNPVFLAVIFFCLFAIRKQAIIKGQGLHCWNHIWNMLLESFGI